MITKLEQKSPFAPESNLFQLEYDQNVRVLLCPATGLMHTPGMDIHAGTVGNFLANTAQNDDEGRAWILSVITTNLVQLTPEPTDFGYVWRVTSLKRAGDIKGFKPDPDAADDLLFDMINAPAFPNDRFNEAFSAFLEIIFEDAEDKIEQSNVEALEEDAPEQQ